jgi:two-component system CheB/CheR fusion protein
LTDLSARINLSTLSQDVHKVLATGKLIERTIAPEGSASQYLLRLAPYRDVSHNMGGVVLGFVDVTSLTRAEAQLKVLIAELNHRVKNMLSVVIGVAEQTYRSAPDGAQFHLRFTERLRAMANSHALLTREHWGATRLEELVKLHLEPVGLERAELDSSDVTLGAGQALSLGMILHELVTNAVKYGALGDPKGHVAIKWSCEGKDLVLTWKERDGPKVKKAARQGFGLRLVTQEASYSLRGKAEVEFLLPGLEVTLRFPREADDDV